MWDYGFGLDVLGLTVLRSITKQTLGQYLQASLFMPLGMTDTGFSISPDKAGRYARPLPADPDTGKPQARSPELTEPLKFECGGGLRGLHRQRLSALYDDGDEWRAGRRGPAARPQDR